MPGHAGAVADGLGDVALAHAGLAHEADVLAPRDEGPRGKVEDLGLGDLGVEVEVFEPLSVVEAHSAQAHVELLGVTPLDLVGHQAQQELGVRQTVVIGLPGAQLERAQHAGHAQLLQDGDELARVGARTRGQCPVRDGDFGTRSRLR